MRDPVLYRSMVETIKGNIIKENIYGEEINTVLGPDYMEGFQPGLSFSLVNRAEISARTSYVLLRKQRFRLHDKKFSPG